MSTVLDVALALLLISASVLVIGIYLDGGDDTLDEDRADRSAQTLGATTISVTYDTSAITESDHFEEPAAPTAYEQAAHGPAASLLGEAAVTNAQFDGEQFILYNETFDERVDANIQSEFVGANHQLYATASWEPYENSTISGTATTGTRPPVTEDTGSATITVSSGMSPIDEQAVAGRYATAETNDPSSLATRELAEPIAKSVIEGYFPPEDTQLALERNQLDRSLLVAHYLRLSELVGVDDPAVDGGPLARAEADAETATSDLAAELADVIEQDIESGPIGDELETIVTEHDMTGTIAPETIDEIETLLSERVTPDRVVISVQTWNS